MMSAALDHFLVWGLIAAALGFFVRRFLRKRAAGKACGGGCCATRVEVRKRS